MGPHYAVLCDWLLLLSMFSRFTHVVAWSSKPFLFTDEQYSLPWWLSGKESTCQRRRWRRHGFYPWIGKIPWRRKWQPTPAFLPRKSHGRRSLAGYSPWSRKESDTWSNWAHTYTRMYTLMDTPHFVRQPKLFKKTKATEEQPNIPNISEGVSGAFRHSQGNHDMDPGWWHWWRAPGSSRLKRASPKHAWSPLTQESCCSRILCPLPSSAWALTGDCIHSPVWGASTQPKRDGRQASLWAAPQNPEEPNSLLPTSGLFRVPAGSTRAKQGPGCVRQIQADKG